MNFFIGRIDEVRNRSLCALRIGYGYVVEFVFRRATPKALGGDPHDLAAGCNALSVMHAWWHRS